MTTFSARRVVLVAATVLAAAWASASAAESGTYSVRYLEPGDAISLIYVRVPETQGACRLISSQARDAATAGQRGVIDVQCNTDGVVAKIEQALAAIDGPPATRRFHVMVLTASRKEGTTPDLPPSEAKALADAKQVMSYRSFRVEAETILQTDRNVETQLSGTYELEIALTPARGGDGSIEVRRFRLRNVQPTGTAKGATTVSNLFDTSFSLRQGETIVLGASSAGDAACMVLVTALP